MENVHWKCRFHIATVVAMVVATPLGAQQPFDRSAWLADYGYLRQTLERRYANLAWFASNEGGVDLPALNRRAEATLRAAESDDDARAAIEGFVRGFRDGHFRQDATLAVTLASSAPRLPNPVFSRDDPATGCAALNFPSQGSAQLSLPFEGLPGFRLIADGIATPFRAGIIRIDADSTPIGIVRIASFEESADQGLCRKVWTRPESWNAQGRLARGRLIDAIDDLWYATLAELLRSMKTAGAAALIVDVGNNSGGDDSGDIATRLFSDRPIHSSPLLLASDSTVATPYFEEQIKALRDAQKTDSSSVLARTQLALFEERERNVRAPACDMSWVWRERRAWSGMPCRRLIAAGSAGGPLDYLARGSERNAEVAAGLQWSAAKAALWASWTGPLFVLTDARTHSSAEMFTAVLRNNGAAQTVGVRTGGDGCGFMDDPGPVTLPNSHMRFQIPNCVRLRADSADEVAGIAPDIPVLPTQGENARFRAMRALVAVRAAIRGR